MRVFIVVNVDDLSKPTLNKKENSKVSLLLSYQKNHDSHVSHSLHPFGNMLETWVGKQITRVVSDPIIVDTNPPVALIP